MSDVVLPRLDLTAKDFETIRSQIFSIIASNFPEINDSQASNNGVVLAEAFAFVLANLHYYLDNRVEQVFIDRVTERRCMISLAKLLGYSPVTSMPAEVNLTITATGNIQSDLVIPRGFQAYVSVGGKRLIFETVDDLTLTAATRSGTILARQQETFLETFSGTGEPNQRVQLQRIPFSSIKKLTVEGVEWIAVPGFWDASNVSQVYRIDQLFQNAHVSFGNGIQGSLVTKGNTIRVEYTTSHGSKGNVGKNTIRNLVTGYVVDGVGNRVNLSVTNASPSGGGDDAETLSQIRLNATRYARLYARSVAYEDFEFAVESQMAAVQRVGVLTVNDFPDLPENTVMTVLKMHDGFSLNDSIRAEVERILVRVYPRTLTLDLLVGEAVLFPVDHQVRWEVTPGYSRTEVEERMLEALEGFYDLDQRNTKFGQPVYHSVIVRLLQGVEGVKFLHLLTPATDVYPNASREIPILGEVTFLDFD